MKRRLARLLTLPLLTLIVGLGFTLFVSTATHLWIQKVQDDRFARAVFQTTLLLKNRLDSNVQLIRSLGGLFYANKNITREAFSDFFTTHDISKNFPGIQALGYGPVVLPQERQNFEKMVRDYENIKDFSIFPAEDGMAVPVYYLYPFNDQNRRALGYDMTSELTRKNAMLQAIKSGQPTLSGPIDLVQEDEERAGFLIYYPLYIKSQTGLEVDGFAYAAIKAKNLFEGLFNIYHIPVDIEIYDGEEVSKEKLLYDSNPDLNAPDFLHKEAIQLYGRTWILCVKSNTILDMGFIHFLPLIELVFGVLFSFVASAWLLSLSRTNERAQYLAQEMTYTIRNQMKIIDENVITSEVDMNGKITAVSSAFCKISGYDKEELIGRSIDKIKHPETSQNLYQEIWSSIQLKTKWEGEIKNQHQNGSYYWVYTILTPRLDTNGELVGFTSICQDITDKKRTEELSITDPLTGLYNRLKLDELFEANLHNAQRHETPFSIILLDIDKFKNVNDTFGHQAGDGVLKEFAALLKENLRTEDILGRWGGEEFLILIPNSDLNGAAVLAEKLRLLIHNHSFATIGHKTSSFGVSTHHYGDDEKSMVSRADEALYRAKQNGRNRVETEEHHRAAMRILSH